MFRRTLSHLHLTDEAKWVERLEWFSLFFLFMAGKKKDAVTANMPLVTCPLLSFAADTNQHCPKKPKHIFCDLVWV